MALIRYGGGIVQMSGSIAGDTFARNRYGNYSRARTKPTNPNTSRQQTARTALAETTVRWSQTLTALQRAAWGLYGDSVAMKNRLGEVIKLTGFNHYIRSNSFRIRAGFTPVDDGPVIFELPAKDPAYSIAISEAAQQITTIYDDTMDWDNETGGFLILSHGQPQNAQRNFFGGPWRIIGAVAGVDGAPVASPAINAVGFAVAEGQHNWCFARIARADGRLSEPFRDDTFCGA